MAQTFACVLKCGQEERSIHTDKWGRKKKSSMLCEKFVLRFVVMRYKLKGFLLGVPFRYIAELSLDLKCARSMLIRVNILVISTSVLKQWDAGPRQIKLSCWKCCEIDHYRTAPPVVFFESVSIHLQCSKTALSPPDVGHLCFWLAVTRDATGQ
jgi:hypothetical protein